MQDEEINLAKSLESNCSQIYSKMFALEKELNLLLNVNNNNNINNNNHDNSSNSEFSVASAPAQHSVINFHSIDGSDHSLNVNQNDSSMTLTDLQSDHVPSMPAMKDEESILLVPTITASQENSQQQCDDNQNNMNNRMVSGGGGVAGERIRANLKQLLALYAKLKRQLVEFTEAKANEQSSYKAKCDELSCLVSVAGAPDDPLLTNLFPFQLMSLKLDLDSRPTQEDFDDKVQTCNALRTELSNLSDQMACNEKLLEQMQMELSDERERQMEKRLEERAIQTEADESTNEAAQGGSNSSVLESPAAAVEAEHKSSTKMPQSSSPSVADDSDDDDALNNHPKVLYEDELIVFKEKCTNLSAENVRLQREVGELRANMSHFHNSWLHNFMLKYLVPVLIVFVAYIFYLLK